MMNMKGVATLTLCLCLAFGAQHGEEVKFGSRLFTVATAEECTDHAYDDPKNTGSLLLSKYGANQGQFGLSMDIQLVHYVQPSSAGNCFRAHPVFTECVQGALSYLKNSQKRALVFGGYRLPSEIGSSTAEEDVFAAAGTHVKLIPESSDPNDLLDITMAVLRYCPSKLERINRNIGVVLKATEVHLFMESPYDPPVLRVDGYPMPQADFETQALLAITAGLEIGKKSVAVCGRFPRLLSGEMFPENATSAEGTVGEADTTITRDDAVEFGRLVQYLGTTVKFDNVERSAAWCGSSSGLPCVDCRNGPVDATLGKRCTARMMTPRMRDVLTLLQKLTSQTLSDSVRVIQAWDEDYDGHTADPLSLHREGRALLVALESGSTSNLEHLAQLAICASADFVEHQGSALFIAVEKQHGDDLSETEFPQADLIRVDPPVSKDYMFALPDFFNEDDHARHPIFDSAGREELEIAPHTMLGFFTSSQTRYLRLNPTVVQCFSKLQDYFVKREETDGVLILEVVRGFMTTPERDMAFTSEDYRSASPTLGESFEVRVNSNSSTQNISMANLARLAIIQCASVFQDEDEEMGVGVYHDRVFVDMRETFEFRNPSGTFSSHVSSAAEFKSYMRQLYDAAVDDRIVEPDVPAEAAALAEPPERQSITYSYVTPERVLRRRQTPPVAGECVPNTTTSFCQRSKPFRDELVAQWWKEAVKKHNYHDLEETKTAFHRCFGDCGTCTSGLSYEDKVEHCSNYLHWSPFEMAPEGTSINIFPRERAEMRKCACQGGSAHCIEDSALFLLLVNLFEATFRPDATSSASEDMYPQTENPSPVPELINELYAIHHVGEAKVWVEDETDIAAMRKALEKLMLYNPNVTEVMFYVNDSSSGAVSAVNSILQSLILEWTTGSSPLYTREFVAPFRVEMMPQNCIGTSKRSVAQHTERDRLIERIASQEDRLLRFDL